LDLAVGLEPVNAFALLAPEAVRVLDRLRVHRPVFGVVGERTLRPVCWNVVDLFSHRFLRTAVAQSTFSHGHFACLSLGAGVRTSDKAVQPRLWIKTRLRI